MMRTLASGLLGLTLAACNASAPASQEESKAQTQVKLSLLDLGQAPELQNEIWLNSEQLLRLVDLRSKVVLLDMWTFGCINCQRVIPYLRDWHERYRDQGLVVIGNHYPEFAYEQDLGNLREALVRLDVPYPVAQDNDRATWSGYLTRFWPTLFLIDKRGHIRYTHIGEGRYAETELAIPTLLFESYP